MAKLTGPLMSISASGRIAKTLVYATWKGLKYARQYVVPANPNTAGQQTQRGYLSSALAAWHGAVVVLTALDKTNLNREALYASSPMSGFNRFVQNYIETVKAAASILSLYNTTEANITSSGAEISCSHGVASASVDIRYGTSPTALVNIQARDEGATPGGTSTFSLTGLQASTTYYYQIYSTVSNSAETIGIGKFTTLAS